MREGEVKESERGGGGGGGERRWKVCERVCVGER